MSTAAFSRQSMTALKAITSATMIEAIGSARGKPRATSTMPMSAATKAISSLMPSTSCALLAAPRCLSRRMVMTGSELRTIEMRIMPIANPNP